jgi:hypothetical protein
LKSEKKSCGSVPKEVGEGTEEPPSWKMLTLFSLSALMTLFTVVVAFAFTFTLPLPPGKPELVALCALLEEFGSIDVLEEEELVMDELERLLEESDEMLELVSEEELELEDELLLKEELVLRDEVLVLTWEAPALLLPPTPVLEELDEELRDDDERELVVVELDEEEAQGPSVSP